MMDRVVMTDLALPSWSLQSQWCAVVYSPSRQPAPCDCGPSPSLVKVLIIIIAAVDSAYSITGAVS